MHSVKTAAQMTGLSPDVLRAWERRYGVVRPKRDAKGRRIYDAADLRRLRMLGRVVSRGYPVYRAARLSLSQLEQLLAESTEREVGEHYASFVEHALAGADAYRPDQCDEALGLAMATLSPREVVSEVFSPLLHEAGERWRRGALSMAQEHMLTASVERLLMATIHLYQKIAVGPRLMFGTLGGERHGIGSLMAAFIASAQGSAVVIWARISRRRSWPRP